jgi:hypothetical protein
MPITRPILGPERIAWRLFSCREHFPTFTPCFFDDIVAVMYRKIDTTPLSSASPQYQGGSGEAVGFTPDSRGLVVESDHVRVVF